MISTSDLRKGLTIELDGQLYAILDYQHIKVGRGSAQVRLRLRDIRAGHITERTFQAGERFSRARLDRRHVQFMYSDGDLYHFMDNDNYEQFALNGSQLGDNVNYLKDGLALDVLTFEGEPIAAELPLAVELTVTDTPPGFRGDTASGGSKPATTESGLVVPVPFFVNVGDVIRVDTRNGTYLERVS